MKSVRYFPRPAVLLPGIVVAAAFFAACNQGTAPPPSSAPPAQKVYVQFEGPWFFATDPKDPNMVLFIAPKAKGHRDLFVKASNGATLASGMYELAVPPRSGTASGTRDRDIYQAKVDAANLQRALDSKGGHYSVRLPKPEAFVAAGRIRSRVGPTYPPDATTEKDYATEVSLVYSVGSLSGFSLAGTPDSGSFDPLLLQVESPLVRFVIEPDQYDDPVDLCSLHSRASFHDLTKLVGLTLYVDFPNDPADCHKKDPQNAFPAKSAVAPPATIDRLGQLGSTLGDLAVLAAHRRWSDFRQHAAAAYYFFGHPGMNCKAPIIDGGP